MQKHRPITTKVVFLWIPLIVFGTSCSLFENESPFISLDSILQEEIKFDYNPNQITPLSAYAYIKTKFPSKISVLVDGNPIVHKNFYKMAREHKIPIHGLYPDTLNQVRIRVLNEEKRYAEDTLYIPTSFALENSAIKKESLPVLEDSRKMFLVSGKAMGTAVDSNSQSTNPYFLDANGRMRWYLNLSSFGDNITNLIRLANGNFIFGSKNQLFEVNMMGDLLRKWKIESDYSILGIDAIIDQDLICLFVSSKEAPEPRTIQTATFNRKSKLLRLEQCASSNKVDSKNEIMNLYPKG